ncbi:MAG: hypothetical protein FWD61_02270 [Phycisphaerales bacterium]|nr:hypothetical protein [Phycisphaerales bacterium]
MSERKEMTRREMICSAGRYVALGGLVLGVGRLVGGNEGGGQKEGSCAQQLQCSRCGSVADCRLPEGVAARHGKSTG